MGPLFRTLAISLVLLCSAASAQIAPFAFMRPPATSGGGVYSANVQAGAFSIAAWTDSSTVTVTAVDSVRSFALISYYGTSNMGQYDLSEPILRNSNTVAFRRGDGGANYTVYGQYYLVSDTGLSMQRKTRTVANDSVTFNTTITAVDTNKSFVLLYALGSGAPGYYSYSYWRPYLFSGNVRMIRDVSGDNGMEVAAQVVTYDSCTVQQKVQEMGVGTASSDITISSVDVTKTMVLVYASGASIDDPSDGNIYSELTTATNLRLTRLSSGVAVTVTAYVVEFTDDSEVQAGEVNIPPDALSADTSINTTATDRTFLVGNGMYLSGGKTYAASFNQAQAQTKLSFPDAFTVMAERNTSGVQTRVRFYAVTLGGRK